MSKHSYALKRWFSLLGIAPIGAYVVIHLYKNMTSLQGPDAFNQMLNEGRGLPLIVPIMLLLVWIPLAFHGIYGLFVMKQSKPNLPSFPFFGNLKYVLQRLSGIGLLLFIPAHLYKSKIGPALEGREADFNHMVDGLSDPITLTVYLLGVLGVAYHLANGLWQFSIGWGIAITEKGMRRMQWISIAFFVALAAMGYAAIWGLVSY